MWWGNMRKMAIDPKQEKNNQKDEKADITKECKKATIYTIRVFGGFWFCN